MNLLATFLLSITGSITARVLTSLGIGIFSYASLTTVAGQIAALAQGAFNGMAGDVLSIVSLAGFGEGFAYIASAILTRASLSAIKQMRPI